MKNFSLFVSGIMLPLAAMLSTGCRGKTGNPAAPPVTDAAPREAPALPLPQPPAHITDPGERARYAALHFWDPLNPSDHTVSLDSALMEQTFANYIALLPYLNEQTLRQSVGAFADKCSGDKEVYDLAVYIAHHYLDDPNSPLRSEEIYIPFLERFASDPGLPETTRERSAYRLSQAMKNRPGMRAADFRLVSREGRTSNLLRELSDTTLVLFYDYDCEHCKETVTRLADPAAGVRYPVVAVEVTEDREGWDATKSDMPQGWNVCFAAEPIDGEAYYFPALPSAYLLAPDGTVLIKDASL